MSVIPANECTPQDLRDWDEATKELAKWKAKEMLLRLKIFNAKFPQPKEGTNTVPLANGWVMKGTHVITRELDEPLFLALQDECVKAGFNPQALVKRKPSLVVAAYRELTAEQQKFFDRALIIKEGTPSLIIELPAKNRPKEA